MPTLRNITSLKGRQQIAPIISAGLAPIPSDYHMRLIGTTDYLTIVNTNRVSSWAAVGGTHTATQGDNAVRPFYDPLYVTPNGKQTVFSNGRWMTLGVYSNREFISNTDGQTIVVVGTDWTNDGDHIFAKWDPDANERCYRLQTNTYSVQSNGGSVNVDQVATFTRPAGSFVLMAQWYPSTDCAVYKDGSASPLGSAASPAASENNGNEPVKIFSNSDSNERLNTGSVAEIIIYKRKITMAEWAIINTNLQRFWLL
jgi:hypothetical protein